MGVVRLIMIIGSLKELEKYGQLELGDTVYFIVGEESVEYTVDSQFLRNANTRYADSRVFILLEIDKYELAEKTYGYTLINNTGFWPYSKLDDYPALTRLVKEIYKIVEGPEEDYTPILARWELLDIR